MVSRYLPPPADVLGRRGIPLWLKLTYTAWMAAWVPVYWSAFGPSNFLWLCDVANFIVCAALWLESPLLFSAQACGVLLIQLGWALDFFGNILLRFHPIGGTEYMFDPAEPVITRCLSAFFHLAMPGLLLWAIARLGFDRRGVRFQTALAWAVLPLSFFVAGPEVNLNWVWGPFGKPQSALAPWLYLLVTMAAYPLLLYVPTHLALAKWAKRR